MWTRFLKEYLVPVKNKSERLAPAGNIESFFAAVENGADAVYLGLKRFNARATATNFTLEEVAGIIPFAHGRDVRIYITVNSLIAATEIPEVLDLLNALATLGPDALIVQDAGIFYLARRQFPGLKLHASTLAAAHNSAGVQALDRMGAQRVVLARELGLGEIEKICATTKTELEIFIHGALCYSYSGLCLTSSFRGGRSGLRGECVQPCRLKFHQGKKEGFFLSCNDFCALPLMPRLKKLRIAGFKIEGRMKPAAYIGNVVKAYRGVLDAVSEEEEKKAIELARELLARSPSRPLTSGHLEEVRGAEVLTPHRSGASGIWSATVKAVETGRFLVDVRYPVAKGDRLRPESSTDREEEAFTVSEIFDKEGKPVASTQPGHRAFLVCAKNLSAGDRLFNVGEKSISSAQIWKKIRGEIPAVKRFQARFPNQRKALDEFEGTADFAPKEQESLFIRVGTTDDLVKALQSPASTVLLHAGRTNLERVAKQRFSPQQMRKLGFSLPALLSESKDMEYYRAAIKWFIGKGFRLWEVNNWGHFALLGEDKDLRRIAGSGLHLRNGAALAETTSLGCGWSVISLETTKEELIRLANDRHGAGSIICVYCWPPLFTSRLIPNLAEEKPFFTARNDAYIFKKQGGHALIYADRPISWLDELPFLRSLGFRRFLIDAGQGPGKRSNPVESVLSAFQAARSPKLHSDFNLERRT